MADPTHAAEVKRIADMGLKGEIEARPCIEQLLRLFALELGYPMPIIEWSEQLPHEIEMKIQRVSVRFGDNTLGFAYCEDHPDWAIIDAAHAAVNPRSVVSR